MFEPHYYLRHRLAHPPPPPPPPCAALPTHPVALCVQYLVAPPFAAINMSGCSACSTATAGGAAYQLYPNSTTSGRCPMTPPGASWSCYALGLADGGGKSGGVRASNLPPKTAGGPSGIRLTFGGGDGDRGLAHEVSCDVGKPLHSLNTTIGW